MESDRVIENRSGRTFYLAVYANEIRRLPASKDHKKLRAWHLYAEVYVFFLENIPVN
jgi:hypothetical protein